MRKLPNPPRYDGGAKLPPLLDCKPFRGPKLTEEGRPFEPVGFEIGAEIAFKYKGEPVTGQVWSLAPGGVWAVADQRAYRVSARHPGLALEIG